MKNANKILLLLLSISVFTLATWIVRANKTASGDADSLEVINMKEQEQSKSPKDPCGLINLKDKSIPYEKIKERQDRQMQGYPSEISLSEAIRIFNEEKQCASSLATYPPLSEDELIAAIVAGSDYGKPADVWRAQKEALWKIAKQKVMPKGSLLITTIGAHIQDSPLRPNGTIRAEGMSIILLLGLENHEYGELLKPEQSFTIRRTYFKVETVK
jgi:hypothetical protein